MAVIPQGFGARSITERPIELISNPMPRRNVGGLRHGNNLRV
jgi:hypothetical protein